MVSPKAGRQEVQRTSAVEGCWRKEASDQHLIARRWCLGPQSLPVSGQRTQSLGVQEAPGATPGLCITLDSCTLGLSG